MSMGVVCAEDMNQTVQDTLELADVQDVISDDSEKSYTDLFDAINKTDDTITLESDYKYQDSDKIKYIEFKQDYTIDGKNHVVDADGKATIFKASNSVLTLKNLILKNTNDSAILLQSSRLITENVTFMNTNSADFGGAVYCANSNYYSTMFCFLLFIL